MIEENGPLQIKEKILQIILENDPKYNHSIKPAIS